MKLQKQEQILFIIKKHFFGKILLGFGLILSIFSGILFFIFGEFGNYKILIFLGYIQIVIFTCYYVFIKYSLGGFLVSNKRIIYVKKRNIFEYEYMSLFFQDIKKIDVIQKGFWANALNFGNIIFYNHSQEKIIFFHISHPKLQAKNTLDILSQKHE